MLLFGNDHASELIVIMQTDYLNLLTVSIRHDYYSDGVGRDLLATPSADTAKILTKFDAHWRGSTAGFSIIGSAEAKAAMANLRLRFFLQATTPHLFFVTGLEKDDTDLSTRGYHFVNSVVNSEGSGELTVRRFNKIATTTFPFAFQAAEKTVDLNVTQLAVDPVQVISMRVVAHDASNGQHHFQTNLNLTDYAPGLFQVDYSHANGEPTTTIIYGDDEASSVHNLFGIVDLDLALLPEPTPSWGVTLQLRSRAAQWVYLVPKRRGLVSASLEDHHSKVGEVLEVVPQAHSDVLEFKSNEDSRGWRFESKEPVRFSEDPRKNLVLTYSDGSHPRQRILPNPDPGSVENQGGRLIAETMIFL